MSRIFILLLILHTSWQAFAGMVLPVNMSSADREVALGVLGFGSAAKLLSSPYALGGYDGVEVGVSSEYIHLADVASLGSKSNSRSDVSYMNVTLGKGLFYNVDVFLQFVPMPQGESISGYGGQMRWGFYEAKFMPAALSFVAHGSAMNFNNLVGTHTTGVDLVGSVNMRDVSLFFGVGQGRSVGTFVGGAGGLTDSGLSETTDVISQHTLFGISVKMSNVFLALEVDRYVQSTYAGKMGLRF